MFPLPTREGAGVGGKLKHAKGQSSAVISGPRDCFGCLPVRHFTSLRRERDRQAQTGGTRGDTLPGHCDREAKP